MKKFLYLIMAFVMIFAFAACGKKIVVNKKPHVETSSIDYDETEIIALEDTFEYCGMEYELLELTEELELTYNGEFAFNITCEEDYLGNAETLALQLEEKEIKYTINGVEPTENDSKKETPDIIAE